MKKSLFALFSTMLMLVFLSDTMLAQQSVTIRDLNTYDHPLTSQNQLSSHPLVGEFVEFEAVIVSYPRNSGLANAFPGELPARIHVFVVDVNAAEDGLDGNYTQIVASGPVMEDLYSLDRGDIISVEGSLTFFGNSAQFAPTTIIHTGSVFDAGNAHMEFLLEPTVISMDELNVASQSSPGRYKWNADNYTNYIYRYVKLEAVEVGWNLEAPSGRPWFITTSNGSILTSNDSSLRYRNDRIGYADGFNFNWRRRAEDLDGTFNPPSVGSLINLSGFVINSVFDPMELDESQEAATFKVAPWDDGVIWIADGFNPADRTTPAGWPVDLTVSDDSEPVFDNIIFNADFSDGLTHWTTFVADWTGVNANFSVQDGEAAITNISGAGGEVWFVQFNQILLAEQIAALEVGATYEAQFDARSSVDGRPLRLYFGEDGGGFIPVNITDVTLNQTAETFESVFNLTDVFGSMKFGFEMGTSNDDVFISNVSLTRVDEVIPTGNDVTFQVNMNHYIDLGIYNPGIGHRVYVMGDFNEWSPQNRMMDYNGNGIYEFTRFVEGAPGTNQEYKFFISTPEGGVWETFVGPDGMDNRLLTLTGSAQILPVVYFNNEPGDVGEIVINPPADPSMLDDLPLSFNVDTNDINWAGYPMFPFEGAELTRTGNPDQSGINETSFVIKYEKIAGSMPWAGFFYHTQGDVVLDDDSVFRMKVWSPRAGINALLKLENRQNPDINTGDLFVPINAANEWVELEWNLSNVPREFGYDRVVFIMDLQGDQSDGGSDYIWYLDDFEFTDAVIVDPPPVEGNDVTFSVNMNVFRDLDIYIPEIGDEIYLKGSFNDWSVQDQMFDNNGNGIYNLTLFVEGDPGTHHEYKFYILSGDGRDLPNDGWETNVGDDVIWGNRILTLTGSDQVLPTVYFDNNDGGDPPSASVTPGSFEIEAEQGENVTRALTISNNGGSPLEFNLGVSYFYTEMTRQSAKSQKDLYERRSELRDNTTGNDTIPFGSLQAFNEDGKISFEADDGFHLGYIGGQQGWMTHGMNTLQPAVSDVRASHGDWSLELAYHEGLEQGSSVAAFSPGFLVDEDLMTFNYDFFIEATGGAAYDIVMQSFSLAALTARVRFAPNGDILVVDYNDVGELAYVSTGTNYPVNQWFEITVEIDRLTASVNYYVNNELIRTGAHFGANVVDAIVFVHNNFQDGEAAYVDNIRTDSRTGWVSADITSGVIAAGQSETINLTFDTNQDAGTYLAQLVVSTNAPVNPNIGVPVMMTITGDVQPPDVDYAIEMIVSDTKVNSLTLIMGTAPDATTGFDAQYDEYAPPAPPEGAFDARIRYGGDAYFSFFQPTIVEETQWNVRFAPESGFAPVTLSWDPAVLPEEGVFYLRDIVDGSFVNVNMRQQNNLVVTQAFITELTLTHTLVTDVEIDRNYMAGWNIVGLPVEAEHDNFLELFTGALANTLFRFNGSYQSAQTLDHGTGYWLRYGSSATETFTGVVVDEVTVNMTTGWNLVSGPSATVSFGSVNDPNGIIVPGTLFGFNGAYVSESALEPGRGYWLRANASGAISFESTGTTAVLASLQPYMLENHHRINISSGEISRELYFGDVLPEGAVMEQFSLPPLPPEGAFDARLSGGWWLSETEAVIVELQRTGEPVTISIEGTGDYLLTMMNGPVELGSTNVTSGEMVTLTGETNRISIAIASGLDAETPAEFSLLQNYPNPFNPSTLIRYSLPETVHVRIEVYNITGQRVVTLVNAQQDAGYHTVTFDADRLASGIYLYRMQAGSYVQVQKMMFVK